MSREPKILVLGQTSVPEATCVEWMQDKLPNFADFDVVFVNEVSLGDLIRALPGEEPDFEDARRISDRQQKVKEGLVRLIASQWSRVYVVLDKGAVRVSHFDTQHAERRPYFLKNSVWCPVPIERDEQEGDTVLIVNDDFKAYFEGAGVVSDNGELTFPWHFTLAIKSEEMDFSEDPIAKHFDSEQGKRTLYPIATNRQKQPIAAAFAYEDMRINLGSNGRGGWNYGDQFSTGTVVFLPPPASIGGEDALLLLYETVKKNMCFPLNKDWDIYEAEKLRSRIGRLSLDQLDASITRPPFVVSERREIPLLTSQKDAIFTALRDAGLDLTQFEWAWTQSSFDYRTYEVQRLLHRPSGYHFTFDKQASSYPNVWIARYSPGENQREETREGSVEDIANLAVHDWPRFLQRELTAPDFWGQLASNPLVLAQASTTDDNSRFRDDEHEELLRRLASIESRLIEFYGDTLPRLSAIEKRMEEIRNASTRIGRKDWIMLVVGQLFNLVATLGLDGEKAREVFELVGVGLKGFAGLLPS